MKYILVGVFLMVCVVVQAQSQTYRNLVLEGGGVRGIAYGGAIAELEQRGVMDSVCRVGGTSAGAIQAALLCLGYSASDITQLTYELPVRKMNDGRYIFVGGTRRLFKNYGWYRGEAFIRWMEKQIAAKTGNPNRHRKDWLRTRLLTFGRMYQHFTT